MHESESLASETRPRDWLAAAQKRLADVLLAPRTESIGRIVRMADGVIRVSGLPEAALDELLELEGGQAALVRTLDTEYLTAVLLDELADVQAGHAVRAHGKVASVPVGPGLLGRVVDPLGRPLDGGVSIHAAARLPIERAAPPIVARAPLTEPVRTGVLVVDALFALGRGQRELIVGDRSTGKSSLALDALINQRDSDLITVYVAIGQRASATERTIAALHRHGAAERCIVVVAAPSSPPGLQWIAPFAATSMAEYFRDQGSHVLIVYDDLTQHAATHRELALLSDEAPGREAYPGDIFYLHARLLERAAQLSAASGGGSLTALPIAETEDGNLAGYIPTNLISITDGQIVLDRHRFAANLRPAVDVGTSVSRVGGKVQRPALRRLAGRLRLDYAQFLELETFTRFGGLVDARARARVARGERIRALLTQPRFTALREIDEVALLAALAAGVFDAMTSDRIPALRAQLSARLDLLAPEVIAGIDFSASADESMLDPLVDAVRALVATLAGQSVSASAASETDTPEERR